MVDSINRLIKRIRLIEGQWIGLAANRSLLSQSDDQKSDEISPINEMSPRPRK